MSSRNDQKYIPIAEQKRRLRDFCDGEARDIPPVFAGRTEVLADIEKAAEVTLRRWQAGKPFPGLTRMVQGAPGAGKTSLLFHLQRQWEKRRDAGDQSAPIAVNIRMGALIDPHKMRMAIDEALPKGAVREWGPVVSGALASLVAPAVAARAVSEGARALFEQRKFSHPIVLMVDEAQETRPHQPEAETLRSLHQGHLTELPVLPVLAGLGHLSEHMGQRGIGVTRTSREDRSVHTLGGLTEGETRDLFNRWMELFGIRPSKQTLSHWADALVRDCQGWPMHVNHFLAALANQLVEAADPGQLASADLGTARREAAGRRLVYYGTRYDHPHLRKRIAEVGQAMADARLLGPADYGTTLGRIAKAFGGVSEEAAEAFFSTLRERGFFQPASDPNMLPSVADKMAPTYVCPIPSLASCAAARLSQAHLAAMIGDGTGLTRLAAGDTDLGGLDAMGRTPLHVAAESRWEDAVRVLLEAGIDPEAPDASGMSARTAWPDFDWPAPNPSLHGGRDAVLLDKPEQPDISQIDGTGGTASSSPEGMD